MDQKTVRETPALRLRRRRWWMDVILGITLFVCGFLMGGVVVTKVYPGIQPKGKYWNREYVRLTQPLDLNEKQAQQMRVILEKSLEDLWKIRRSVRPQIDTTLKRVRDDVSLLLDERQKQIWDKRFDQMSNRRFPPIPEKVRNEEPPDSQ